MAALRLLIFGNHQPSGRTGGGARKFIHRRTELSSVVSRVRARNEKAKKTSVITNLIP